MIHVDYIVEVLGRFEGKQILTGYIPCKNGNYQGEGIFHNKEVLGISGVTIGTGFDLGQQTETVLVNLSLPFCLEEKLRPYIGLKKAAALKALFEKPLTITHAEVEALDTAVHLKYINETADMFGRERFETAPKQVQAVAVSLHYQFGTPRRAASPSLGLAWDNMKHGDYGAAAGFLSCVSGWSLDHRQFMKRRAAEAELLAEAVNTK